MHILYLLIGVLGGICITLQSGVNAQLSAVWAKNSILAAAVSFGVGFLVLAASVAALRIPLPSLKGTHTKWWHWSGGLLGAYLVFAGAYLAPILGAGLLVGLILAGQICSAAILDHFGLVGFPKKPITTQKVIGILFLVVGVAIFRFF